MHFDLAHALVSVILLFGILQFAKRQGWEGFDWRTFALIFVVIFVMNLVWP